MGALHVDSGLQFKTDVSENNRLAAFSGLSFSGLLTKRFSICKSVDYSPKSPFHKWRVQLV